MSHSRAKGAVANCRLRSEGWDSPHCRWRFLRGACGCRRRCSAFPPAGVSDRYGHLKARLRARTMPLPKRCGKPCSGLTPGLCRSQTGAPKRAKTSARIGYVSIVAAGSRPSRTAHAAEFCLHTSKQLFLPKGKNKCRTRQDGCDKRCTVWSERWLQSKRGQGLNLWANLRIPGGTELYAAGATLCFFSCKFLLLTANTRQK